MTFGTSMIPESSNAFVGQALVDALNDIYEEMNAQNDELRKKNRNFKMPINADY